MGLLEWTQAHLKPGSDQHNTIPHEWFSKTPAEPSRQALGEMMKDHANVHHGSPPSRLRSRSNTISSGVSHATKSSSERSIEVTTRPNSREGAVPDLPVASARQEKMSRTLLSKGSRIIRRQTSKLTLLPSEVEDSKKNSDLALGHSTGLNRVKSTSQSPARKLQQITGSHHAVAGGIRPQISGPFGFQHLTHTDKSQYQNLSAATNTDMMTEFHSLQAVSLPASQIKGISVGDLPSSPPPANQTEQNEQSAPASSPSDSPWLPSSPPRPEPPPKDLPSGVNTPDMRSSRLLENFSRPSRISRIIDEDVQSEPTGLVAPTSAAASASPLRPGFGTDSEIANPHSVNASPVPAEALDKPLPQPPNLVHAVSTKDDSALLLRTAPLPQVPLLSLPASHDDHNLNEGHAFSGLKPFASPTLPLRHMQSCPWDGFGRRRSQSSESPMASDLTTSFLGTPLTPDLTEKRISVGLKAIDIEDWENAIDYSWDHDMDANIDADESKDRFEEARQQTDTSSSTSFASNKGSRLSSYQSKPSPHFSFPSRSSNNRVPHSYDRTPPQGADNFHSFSLQGLGIGPVRDALADTDEKEEENDRVGPSVAYPRRTPGSPMSKSSSQESIILSIASSILGTHRSSNSSTSLADLTRFASIEDEQILSLQGNSSESSQESAMTIQRLSATSENYPTANHYTSDTFEALPSTHHSSGSVSDVPTVPNRTSSIAANSAKMGRQRASTLTGKSRYNPRASYSLFPTA